MIEVFDLGFSRDLVCSEGFFGFWFSVRFFEIGFVFFDIGWGFCLSWSEGTTSFLRGII